MPIYCFYAPRRLEKSDLERGHSRIFSDFDPHKISLASLGKGFEVSRSQGFKGILLLVFVPK